MAEEGLSAGGSVQERRICRRHVPREAEEKAGWADRGGRE